MGEESLNRFPALTRCRDRTCCSRFHYPALQGQWTRIPGTFLRPPRPPPAGSFPSVFLSSRYLALAALAAHERISGVGDLLAPEHPHRPAAPLAGCVGCHMQAILGRVFKSSLQK